MSSSSSVTWVTASAAAAGAATLGFLLGRWSACKKDSVVIDSSKPVIGTHSGQFHCDEALACFLLRRTDAYRNAAVVRSRDPAVLDKLDILVDVGGAYDVQTNRFDHHQRGFEETFDDEHQVSPPKTCEFRPYFGLQRDAASWRWRFFCCGFFFFRCVGRGGGVWVLGQS